MVYESHGNFKLWTRDNILCAELTGSWNTETALEFEVEFKKKAEKMPKQWAHLVYLNNWDLGVPEIQQIITRLVHWCLTNGLTRAANIYDESGIKTNLLNKMIVEREGAFVRAVFDDEIKAANWLSSEGFPITLEE